MYNTTCRINISIHFQLSDSELWNTCECYNSWNVTLVHQWYTEGGRFKRDIGSMSSHRRSCVSCQKKLLGKLQLQCNKVIETTFEWYRLRAMGLTQIDGFIGIDEVGQRAVGLYDSCRMKIVRYSVLEYWSGLHAICNYLQSGIIFFEVSVSIKHETLFRPTPAIHL